MKINQPILLSAPITGLILFSGASAVQAQRLPRGSYILKPVSSASDLVSQANKNPKLMERYVRVFNLQPQKVSAALGELRLTTLKKDTVYKVYYVRPGEVLGYRLRTVKAGTQVFALPDGTPAFVKSCGNPLRSDLSGALVKNVRPLNEEPPVSRLSPEDMPAPADETSPAHGPVSLATTVPQPNVPAPELTDLPGEDISDFVPDDTVAPLGVLPKATASGISLLSSLTKGGLIAAAVAAVSDWVNNTNHHPSGGGGGGGTGGEGGVTPVGPGLTPEWNSGTLLLCSLGGVFLSTAWKRRGNAVRS